MPTLEEAREIARVVLGEPMERGSGEPVALHGSLTLERDDEFVFSYTTVAFLETGVVAHALAGLPIVVDRRTGETHLFESKARRRGRPGLGRPGVRRRRRHHGARGTAHVFQNADGVRLQSVSAQQEHPILHGDSTPIEYHVVGGG